MGGSIFFYLATIGAIISAYEKKLVFSSVIAPSFGQSSVGFVIGSVIALFLGFISNSVLTFPLNSVLSSATSTLSIPFEWELFINVIGAGIGEELFFYATPFILISAFITTLPKKWNNNYVFIVLYTFTAFLLFYFFHISKLSLTFFISVFLFRVVATSISFIDIKSNIFPSVFLGLGFVIGWHTSNNFVALNVINQGILFSTVAGWLMVLFFGILYFFGIKYILTGDKK